MMGSTASTDSAILYMLRVGDPYEAMPPQSGTPMFLDDLDLGSDSAATNGFSETRVLHLCDFNAYS